MKNLLNTSLLTVLILAVVYSVVAYGAATLEQAAPLFGAGALLALIWAWKLFTSPRVSWIKSPVHWPVAAFVAYAGLRWLTSPVGYDSRVEFHYVCLYALIYFVVACNLYHRRDLTLIFLALMVLALGESIYGIWQAATFSDKVLFAERTAVYSGRASGTFVNPNHFAGFLAVVFGMVLARIILHRPVIKATFGAYAGPKIIEGYIALVAAAGIVASGSRGSWIAVAIGLVAFLMWAWFPGAVSRYVAGGLALLLLLASVIVFNAPSVRARIAQVVTTSKDEGSVVVKDATLGYRTIMWNASTKIISDHPIFGTGPATWEWFFPPHREPQIQSHPRNAHNDLLQLTAEYGLAGLLIVAVFFAAFFWHIAQLSSFANYSDQRAFAVGAGFSIAVVLLHVLADFHFHVPAIALILIILIALGVAMESGDRYSLRVQMERKTQRTLGVGLVILAVGGAWSGWRLVGTQKLLTAAEDLKATQDYDQAMDFYRQVVGRDSRQYAAHKGIGDVYVALGRKVSGAGIETIRNDLGQRARESYTRSVALNPYDPEVYMGMGDAYRLLNDLAQARAAYEKGLAADPNNLSSLKRLGHFLRESGERERAVQMFARALEIQGADAEAYAALQELRRERPN